MFSCQNYDAHSDVIVGVWQLDSHFEDGIDKKIGDCEKKTVWEFKDGEIIRTHCHTAKISGECVTGNLSKWVYSIKNGNQIYFLGADKPFVRIV